MVGESVPLVMIPRFTSYLGGSTFTTIPLDVSDFSKATLEFWRGHLQGREATPQAGASTFEAVFEESQDPDAPASGWTSLWSTTAVNKEDLLTVSFTRRYFRVRITLVASTSPYTVGLAAITCWAAGSLERRVPGAAQAT